MHDIKNESEGEKKRREAVKMRCYGRLMGGWLNVLYTKEFKVFNSDVYVSLSHVVIDVHVSFSQVVTVKWGVSHI